jgi:hypothetical protein
MRTNNPGDPQFDLFKRAGVYLDAAVDVAACHWTEKMKDHREFLFPEIKADRIGGLLDGRHSVEEKIPSPPIKFNSDFSPCGEPARDG